MNACGNWRVKKDLSLKKFNAVRVCSFFILYLTYFPFEAFAWSGRT